MKYYAKFDESGFPVGFWNDEVFPNQEDGSPHDSVPRDAVQISTQQWQAFIDNSGRRRWEDGHVVPYDPPPAPVTADMIKAEARRRILLVMSEDQQRNSLADALIGGDNAAEAWVEIRRLRVRSNEIEMMDPLPANVKDDNLW